MGIYEWFDMRQYQVAGVGRCKQEESGYFELIASKKTSYIVYNVYK